MPNSIPTRRVPRWWTCAPYQAMEGEQELLWAHVEAKGVWTRYKEKLFHPEGGQATLWSFCAWGILRPKWVKAPRQCIWSQSWVCLEQKVGRNILRCPPASMAQWCYEKNVTANVYFFFPNVLSLKIFNRITWPQSQKFMEFKIKALIFRILI